jgi:hypothetical protein
MVIILISEGDGGKVTLKYTCQWGTFGSKSICSVYVNQGMAWQGEELMQDIQGVENFSQVMGSISVFTSKPADKVPMMEVETQKSTAKEPNMMGLEGVVFGAWVAQLMAEAAVGKKHWCCCYERFLVCYGEVAPSMVKSKVRAGDGVSGTDERCSMTKALKPVLHDRPRWVQVGC